MKVTLHQVAEHAGVSIATASRALNGLAVSQPAGERVRLAAAQLGYVANEAARSLRSERTLTMGLVFYDLRNTLGIELIDALGEGVEAAGYSLLIASARGDAARYDRLMHRFLERRVDALFCITPKGDGAPLASYEAAGTPVIALFDAGAAFAALPLLSPAFSESSAALAEHLAALGHWRVGIVVEHGRSPPLLAVAAALKAASIEVELIEPSEAGGMNDVVAGLKRRRDGPTALVARDPLARGLVAACAAAGVDVPGALSLVSLTEIGVDRRGRQGLSALVVDPHRMGRAAATSMLAWLAGSRPADRTRVQAATFEPRATTGPARPRLDPGA
ncbi:MAG TPA: LacI family DNA-binding transcriptional regulator [Caulobacteraceae bacterium]|nr:LacI family DNA-binding transcriptional regulator [Caulobacteraceae bacterium]